MRTMTVALLTLLAAACGGGAGQVKLSLTDSPAPSNVAKVLITVDEIRVHDDAESSRPPAGADAASASAAADGVDGEGWVVLCRNTATYDLLQLQNGVFAPLCTSTATAGAAPVAIDLPAGRISQLRLHVAAAQVVLTDGSKQDLAVPSGATSGLKIQVNKDVPKGTVLDLKLDFDAGASLVSTSTGYLLKPVLKTLN